MPADTSTEMGSVGFVRGPCGGLRTLPAIWAIWVSMLLATATTTSLHAQPAMQTAEQRAVSNTAVEFVSVGDIFDKMIAWYRAVSGPLASIADGMARDQIVESLAALHKATYDLGSNARYLAAAMSQQPPIASQVHAAVVDTRTSLDASRMALHRVGATLQAQYKAGGDQVEADLGRLMAASPLWLSLEDMLLYHAIQQNRSIDPALVTEATRMTSRIDSANVALAKVIDQIRQSHAGGKE